MKPAAALLMLLLAGCARGPSSRMLILFGGEDTLDLVANPERVEAFRLRPPPSDQPIRHYNEWPTVGEAVQVPPDLAARFSRGLTRESTYPRWEDPKSCDPSPGLMLRFFAAGRHVDVVFCFECRILFTYNEAGSIWYANFDESTRAIASLFLRIYPRDPVLTPLAGKETP